MRRHKQVDGRAAYGMCDAAVRVRMAYGSRHFGIRHEMPEAKGGDRAPHCALERLSIEVERKVEHPQFTQKIRA